MHTIYSFLTDTAFHDKRTVSFCGHDDLSQHDKPLDWMSAALVKA